MISLPGFSRQAYVMLLLLSFFFLRITWSKEISETTRPYLHQIFRGGRYVGVDVQCSIGFATGQPILDLKSATCLPSWDSHSTMDGRMGKQMGALTAQKS